MFIAKTFAEAFIIKDTKMRSFVSALQKFIDSSGRQKCKQMIVI